MEKNKSGQTFMERLAALIVDRRTIIFFIVIGLSLFSVFSRNWVKVCDDITAYLPADTEADSSGKKTQSAETSENKPADKDGAKSEDVSEKLEKTDDSW